MASKVLLVHDRVIPVYLCFLLVLSAFILVCESNDSLPEPEVTFIDESILAYERSQHKSVQRVLAHASTDGGGIDHYRLRSLLLWDPLRQFSCGDELIVCPQCQSKMRPWRWKNGRSRRDRPRNLFCIQEEVLLVSCVYLCEDSHHEVIAHDPSVDLALKKAGIDKPFVLFHKSGVTKELYNYVSISMQSGISIADIERLLMNLHKAQHSYRFGSGSALHRFPTFEVTTKFPGRQLITRIFLRSFLETEEMYWQHMSEKRGRWISFDHTFKASANVGYWESKLWRKLYDSLFIVMNEKSDILGWQLTKGTALEKVKGLLQGLKQRLEGSQIEGIVVDNCCTVRKKLQEIFGENIIVKLDIFHAIQRIVKQIPKRAGNNILKSTRRALLNDLRLCFRQENDHGSKREKPTPCPKIMEGNLLKFVAKWETQTVDDNRVLPDAAVKEVKNLIVRHVNNGCLAYIPPGIGTNRNESLHKKIRKWMKKSRVGISLAVALLSLIFYQHMEKNLNVAGKCKRGQNLISPISEWYSKCIAGVGTQTEERFGIASDSKQNDRILLETNCDAANGTRDYNSNSSDSDLDFSDDDNEAISLEEINKITERAHIMHVIADTTFKKEKAPIKSDKNIWIYSQAILNAFPASGSENGTDYKKLDGILEKYGLLRIPVSGDGNCCFASISIAVEHFLVDGSNVSLCANLNQLGLFEGQSTKERVNLLRSLVVQEWLSDNSEEYTSFLTNSDRELYEDMAKNFLEPGFFYCELGNSVPLALCNILRCPIVLFTSIDDCPILPLVPRMETLSTIPIYATYIQSESGHYDAVTSCIASNKECTSDKMQTDDENLPGKALGFVCSCGRGHSTSKSKPSCKEFKSRCKCYQHLQGCGDNCRCVNCENPHGKRKYHILNQEVGKQRKRRKHDNTPKTTREYMQQRDQPLPQEVWSNYECFVLQQIIELLSCQGEDEIDYDLIYQIYMCICRSAPANFSSEVRSKKNVSAKVDGLLKQRKVFDALFK